MTNQWPARRFAVAPMMDWTDRHCRNFLRLISRNSWLYTEMVTTGAVLHGDRDHLLGFQPQEHPLALQLGGSDPAALAECARIGAEWGYAEINLNVGCPSDRVQSGRFGACLMAEPDLVAECVAAMTAAVQVPVTVKSRTGIDHQEDYEQFAGFIEAVAGAGCETFIVHARKAWLQGLSPKQNRDIPPLKYDWVYRIKRDYPHLEILLNGGVQDLRQVDLHLQQIDGVMIGRQAYHDPYLLAEVDRRLYSDNHAVPSRAEVVQRLLPYVEQQLSQGAQLKHISRHILGLFQGVPGAKAWRRHLSQHAHVAGAGPEVIEAALVLQQQQAPALQAVSQRA